MSISSLGVDQINHSSDLAPRRSFDVVIMWCVKGTNLTMSLRSVDYNEYGARYCLPDNDDKIKINGCKDSTNHNDDSQAVDQKWW